MRAVLAMAMAIAGWLLAIAPAHAQTYSQDQKDARCTLALLGASNDVTGERQLHFRSAMMYFVGKLAGHHTPQEVRALLTAQEPNVKSADIAAIIPECTQELMAIGTVLQQ